MAAVIGSHLVVIHATNYRTHGDLIGDVFGGTT